MSSNIRWSGLFILGAFLTGVALLAPRLYDKLTPEPTPTVVPTATPLPNGGQPDYVTRVENLSFGVIDITDMQADSEAIYVVAWQLKPWPALDSETGAELDAAFEAMFMEVFDGRQKVVVTMFFKDESGEFRFFWVNICSIETIEASGAGNARCDGEPTDRAVHPKALRWLND